MKKIISFALLLFALVGCSSPKGETLSQEEPIKGESNSLVVYFSWSGNVHQMADWVKEYSDSEIYRIIPKDPYSSVYEEVADRAKEEQDNNIFPELDNPIDKELLKKYDTILLGYPVWWYNLPMSVQTFLKDNDFGEKNIIPFFSHAGSSTGAGSLDKISELAPTATVLKDKYLSIAGSSVKNSENIVKEWVTGLNL